MSRFFITPDWDYFTYEIYDSWTSPSNILETYFISKINQIETKTKKIEWDLAFPAYSPTLSLSLQWLNPTGTFRNFVDLFRS